ncbi:MAG: hypothetical protein HYZ35_08135, partial [Chloroflexi bacterium]|nr:hypothetical protein [Chloroflexota bacterium]
MKIKWTWFGVGISVFVVAMVLLADSVAAQGISQEVCLPCHGAPGLEKVREGKTVALHVNVESFSRSVHAPLGCTACHSDVTQIPHAAELKRVQCSTCHAAAFQVYVQSVHGRAKAKGDRDAATCSD